MKTFMTPERIRLARDPEVADAINRYRKARTPANLHKAHTVIAARGIAPRDRKKVFGALVRILGPNKGEQDYI